MEYAFYCIITLGITAITLVSIVAIFCYKHDKLIMSMKNKIDANKDKVLNEVSFDINTKKDR